MDVGPTSLSTGSCIKRPRTAALTASVVLPVETASWSRAWWWHQVGANSNPLWLGIMVPYFPDKVLRVYYEPGSMLDCGQICMGHSLCPLQCNWGVQNTLWMVRVLDEAWRQWNRFSLLTQELPGQG